MEEGLRRVRSKRGFHSFPSASKKEGSCSVKVACKTHNLVDRVRVSARPPSEFGRERNEKNKRRKRKKIKSGVLRYLIKGC